jgi:hypothetical protein
MEKNKQKTLLSCENAYRAGTSLRTKHEIPQVWVLFVCLSPLRTIEKNIILAENNVRFELPMASISCRNSSFVMLNKFIA